MEYARKSNRPTTLAFGLFHSALPTETRAFTLDTLLVRDGGNYVHCIIANLHPSKTCTIQPASGLYGPLATGLPGASSSPSIALTAATLAPGAYTDLTTGSIVGGCNTFNGCLCHFVVTGCPKSTVRAALSLDGGVIVPAD